MNPKPFKTIDQQISILKSRGLLIQNEEAAKNNLRRYGSVSYTHLTLPTSDLV